MGKKARTTKNQPLTLAKAKELLEKFNKLADDGQFEFNCYDSEYFADEVKGVLGKNRTVEYIRLGVEIENFELPPGVNELNCDNYEVIVKVNGNVVKSEVVDVHD